jgi:hypothetical protein
MDTNDPQISKTAHRYMRGGDSYDLKPRSLALLRLPKQMEGENGGENRAASRRARRNGAALNEAAL